MTQSTLPRRPPSLERELLFNLALLTAAALSLAVATALIAQLLEPRYALVALVSLILADVLIVFLFGRYLINRLVVRPMRDLVRAADALAAGNLDERAPPAETRDFTELAERLNHMTERLLDMQGQLVRAEKMASIGHLSAGIAHEVGNPLSAIGTYLDVLQRRESDRDVLAALRREVDRIDGIVRGLIAYARPQAEEIGPVEVAGILRNAVQLLERQGRLKEVDLQVEIEERLPAVRGKAQLLEQVAVNLLLNAMDAAPQGKIAVGASRWRYLARTSGEHRRSDTTVRGSDRPTVRPWRPELPDGIEGVLMWVADSGPGVDPDVRERVFDPFYTTKEPGRGTGLGLAVVQRIVHELGGVIWVDDAREGGAAFKVFLPRSTDPARVGEA